MAVTSPAGLSFLYDALVVDLHGLLSEGLWNAQNPELAVSLDGLLLALKLWAVDVGQKSRGKKTDFKTLLGEVEAEGSYLALSTRLILEDVIERIAEIRAIVKNTLEADAENENEYVSRTIFRVVSSLDPSILIGRGAIAALTNHRTQKCDLIGMTVEGLNRSISIITAQVMPFRCFDDIHSGRGETFEVRRTFREHEDQREKEDHDVSLSRYILDGSMTRGPLDSLSFCTARNTRIGATLRPGSQ